MPLLLDVYEQETFLGSIGIEAGKLVFVGPEKDYLILTVQEDFPGMPADDVVREFENKYRGVTYTRPHGTPQPDPD